MSQTKPVVLNLTDDQLRALEYALRAIAHGKFKRKEHLAISYGRFEREEHKDLCEQIIAQLPLLYSKACT